MERNLALEVVRATEAAALAAARFIGKGDDRMADRAACDAMRKTLNSVAMDGKIVIGEGDAERRRVPVRRRDCRHRRGHRELMSRWTRSKAR